MIYSLKTDQHGGPDMGNYEHRKATDRIRFTDASGNPVADSDVRVKLVKHKFLFGSGANDFLPPEELT